MKKYFLKKFILFLSIPAILLSVVFAAVPATPRSQISLLFSKLDKDALIDNTPAPRLILLGGSNLSFGIDSSKLEEELGIATIDTAIQATIGTEYLMDTTLGIVQPGDVLVLSPEYSQFYGRNAYGGEELLRVIMDVDRSTIKYLSLNQWLNLIQYIPKYTISKLNPREYFLKDDPVIGIYEREAFNEYGDAVIHWGYNHSDFPPYDRIEGKFNHDLIESLRDFKQAVNDRGAYFYITFPGLQEATYMIMEDQIQIVYDELKENHFRLLGTPERYMMDELLMFNTPYHLNRIGVEYRTNLLVEDLLATDVFSGE